jgi:hypothetical protein
MPQGLDFSFAIPQVDGSSNYAFDHSNASSLNNLNVVSSNIMPVNSNMNVSEMDNGYLSPPSELRGMKN